MLNAFIDWIEPEDNADLCFVFLVVLHSRSLTQLEPMVGG